MTIDRRTFLTTLGGVLALASNPVAASARALRTRKLSRIGVQLYSVRDEMKKDVAATLERVARVGYREVEFAGYFDRTPKQIHELLEKNHLSAPSTHVGYETIGDGWSKVLDDTKTVGCEWATIAFMPENARGNADAWKRIADRFNDAAAKAKAAGLRFAYHNHNFEFKPVDGRVPYDILLENTDPKLVDFEMDLYWITVAGGNPLEYFKRFPGRFPLVHVKDSAGPPQNRMMPVGRGTIDFKRIFAESDRAGIKHYFVEHDDAAKYAADPYASITQSYDYLSHLEF